MKPFRSVVRALAAFSMIALPGSADAQFFNAPITQSDGQLFSQAGAADVNGDGKADIVSLRSRSGEPSIWEVRVNDGNGSYSTTEVLGPGANLAPTFADADEDGHIDVFIAVSGGVRLYWGSGDGRFSTFTDLTGTAASIAVGHLNGDSYPDLAIGRTSSPTGVTVRYGLGGRQFGTAMAVANSAFGTHVAIANIDGDSLADLFVLVTPPVSLGNPRLHVLLGAAGLVLGPDSFTFAGTFDGTLSVAMTAADLNGDGISEAVVAVKGAAVMTFAYPAGLPVPQTIAGLSPAAIPPAVTDVDGDGRLDIIGVDAAATTAAVLHGQDDGTFSSMPAFPISSVKARWTLFGDFNGDGALDIVVDGSLISASASNIVTTLHVPPLRISAAGVTATAGADGSAIVTVEAVVESGHGNVMFSWFNGSTPIGFGARVSLSLPGGSHALTVRGATPGGLNALATAVATVGPPPPPASEATVQMIQSTLNTRLDAAVSSRASQESVTQIQGAVTALGTRLEYLDAPVSTRASSTQLWDVFWKVDAIQQQLALTPSLATVTEAVNTLGTSLAAGNLRLAIELALARGDRIASFYLPTAKGGQLDLVRTIVVDVTDKSEAAGGNALSIAKARRSIAEGDARKAAGDYRTAYILYSAAYQVLGA